jgi:acetyl esterase/lipase
VGAIAVGALAAVVLYNVSVEPGAALVKSVFEAGQEVTPSTRFSIIRTKVTESKNVTFSSPGAPQSHVNVYAPRRKSTKPLPVILWVHGGGFVSSSADTVKDYAIMLAARDNVVVNLDYSLAPGAQHPVPVEQANSALQFIEAHATEYGGDPTTVFLGGDSAGAQIASEEAAVQTNPGFAAVLHIQPALSPGVLRGVILFCGLYDMDTVSSTDFPALRTYLWAYTGFRDWTADPKINQLSTTKTATGQFPATFISVGDADPFQTQEAEFARTLRAKGVPVTALTWTGTNDHLGHEYQFNFTTPQAETAFQDTLSFLSARSEVK